jgi:hypothetical protein
LDPGPDSPSLLVRFCLRLLCSLCFDPGLSLLKPRLPRLFGVDFLLLLRFVLCQAPLRALPVFLVGRLLPAPPFPLNLLLLRVFILLAPPLYLHRFFLLLQALVRPGPPPFGHLRRLPFMFHLPGPVLLLLRAPLPF